MEMFFSTAARSLVPPARPLALFLSLSLSLTLLTSINHSIVLPPSSFHPRSSIVEVAGVRVPISLSIVLSAVLLVLLLLTPVLPLTNAAESAGRGSLVVPQHVDGTRGRVTNHSATSKS